MLITGHGDMTTAVDALRKGAYDYLNSLPTPASSRPWWTDSAEHQALVIENMDLRTNMDNMFRARRLKSGKILSPSSTACAKLKA